MTFFSKLFKKHGAAVKPGQKEPVDHNPPMRDSPEADSQITQRARTGDRKFSGKHRSGSF